MKRFWSKLFPCRFGKNHGFMGCNCGKFGSSEKKAGTGIQAAGEQAYQRSAQTPEEAAQYKQSFQTGDLLNQIIQSQMGLGQAPSGYLSPTQQYLQQGGDLGNALYQQTLGAAQDPYAYYQSTLDPQLQQASDFINRQAQQRGLLRSGIPIEQMGRAGVELAIQEANARMNFRQQALQNAQSLQSNISGEAQQNLSNLANLYQQQQGFGQQSLGRQASAAQNTAQYQAYPYQAKLGQTYGMQNALMALPGQAIGAVGQAASAPQSTTNYYGYQG